MRQRCVGPNVEASVFSAQVTANVRRALYRAGWSLEDLALATAIEIDVLTSRFNGRPFYVNELEAIAATLGMEVRALVE